MVEGPISEIPNSDSHEFKPNTKFFFINVKNISEKFFNKIKPNSLRYILVRKNIILIIT